MDDASARAIDILLVEDNPYDVALAREFLRQAKVANRMRVVCDGEEAMAYLRREPPYEEVLRPDLILLDLNLPKKDGHQVLAEVKEDALLSSIPVVVLTSSDLEADLVRSRALHAAAYVRKPVDVRQFEQVVRAVADFWFVVVKVPG